MSKESIVFLFGIVVFWVPFLGVTEDWKRYIIVVSGIVLIIVGYQLRRAAYFRSIEEHDGDHKSESFVENTLEDIREEDEHSETDETRLL